MAKFSVFRDDNDDDEELSGPEQRIRSQKRIRTSQASPSSRSQRSASSRSLVDEEGRQPGDEGAEVEMEERESMDDAGSIAGTSRTRSISVIFSDPDVLDCSICYDPLTIPVFQCCNGHIACSMCCSKLHNKCPSCSARIGFNRCRAIEKVLESVKISCCYEKYGCKEKVSYCDKLRHEEICIYAPCSCPFPDCSFRGSPRRLSQHTILEHSNSVIDFRYNSMFSVYRELNDKCLVLQEETEGVLFILNTGCKLAVKCVEPNPLKGKFTYDLTIRSSSSSLRFQAFTEATNGQQSDTLPLHYLLVPHYFFHSDGRLNLDICIWSKDASHADISI